MRSQFTEIQAIIVTVTYQIDFQYFVFQNHFHAEEKSRHYLSQRTCFRYFSNLNAAVFTVGSNHIPCTKQSVYHCKRKSFRNNT